MDMAEIAEVGEIARALEVSGRRVFALRVRRMADDISRLRADAERYRWLRDSRDSGAMLRLLYEDGQATPEFCDEAIDAAMFGGATAIASSPTASSGECASPQQIDQPRQLVAARKCV